MVIKTLGLSASGRPTVGIGLAEEQWETLQNGGTLVVGLSEILEESGLPHDLNQAQIVLFGGKTLEQVQQNMGLTAR